MFAGLLILILPLLVTTLILAGQARWAWLRTIDKVLRGMKVDEVEARVQKAEKHRQWAWQHGIIFVVSLIPTLVMSLFYSPRVFTWLGWMQFAVFVWGYMLLVPHLLALYLYHVRWNPNTLQRKKKLDAEEVSYDGNYALKPDAQYGVNEEGELVELLHAEEAQPQSMHNQ